MKSNYIKSAELKIAKNPDMSEYDKQLLINEARNKDINLGVKLGTIKTAYTTTDSYASKRGLRSKFSFIDENLFYDVFPIDTTYTTTVTELTRENLQRLIEGVRTTTAQEPTFIGTRNALDAMTYYNRYVDTFPRYFNAMPTFIDTDIEFNF